MRAPQMVNDFFEWRWAPCVGLTAGSLAFVAFALLLIPTRFDGEPRTARTLSAFDSPRTQRALYASSLARTVPEADESVQEGTRAERSLPQSSPQANATSTVLRRGFSPIAERPAPLPTAPAPPPALPAPAPVPPPAAPTAAVVVEPPAPTASSLVVSPPATGGPLPRNSPPGPPPSVGPSREPTAQ